MSVLATDSRCETVSTITRRQYPDWHKRGYTFISNTDCTVSNLRNWQDAAAVHGLDIQFDAIPAGEHTLDNDCAVLIKRTPEFRVVPFLNTLSRFEKRFP